MSQYLMLFSFASFVSGTCNSSRIFSLPVTDVTLSNRQLRRGVPVSVGTPAQNLSMMPQPYLNDTWLYNSTTYFCNSSWTSSTGCLTARGGLYDPEHSTTRHIASNVHAAGGDSSDTARALDLHIWDSVWVNDDLMLGNISLAAFPLGMPGFPIFDTQDTQSQFGLGLNSTLLRALKDAGEIVARAYSWWWGLQGATTQTDGQIVFGGYDSRKVQGNNYTRSLITPNYPTCNSGIVVTITDIVLTFPNSTKSSILSPNLMPACVLPDYPNILTMPYETTYNRFEAVTQTESFGRVGGNGIAFGGVGYWPDNVYEGSLTIEVDNEIEFTFPNELLVVPPSNVATNGAVTTNDSVREVLLNPTTGILANSPGILGRHFLQMAYLMVDYETNSFTLWNANTTSTESSLVALDNCTSASTDSPIKGTSVDPSSRPSVKTSPITSDSENNISSDDQPISTGAVAGIAAGGACAAIAAAAAVTAYILLHRRRRLKPDKTIHATAEELPPQKGLVYEAYSRTIPFNEPMSVPVSELNAHPDPRELEARRWHEKFVQNSPIELG